MNKKDKEILIETITFQYKMNDFIFRAIVAAACFIISSVSFLLMLTHEKNSIVCGIVAIMSLFYAMIININNDDLEKITNNLKMRLLK